MKIDTDHLHYWIEAIRHSQNPMRTMDAFWRGQIKSKEWLIDCLDELVHFRSSIDIYGGWVGVLASMLFQSNIPITSINSIDIDPSCENIANMMNNIEYQSGKFKAVTGNMIDISSKADIVINTSCEHITQSEYEEWLNKMSGNQLIVLQSNNYKIDEHVRTCDDLDTFLQQSNLSKILYKGILELPLYNRFMIIGNI